ncbi:MAG TPA: FlgD immunoglobulin-like domain containing protein [archaeon]|nr:FlgD immunoglobulin-like domain containing protein [archaeon]
MTQFAEEICRTGKDKAERKLERTDFFFRLTALSVFVLFFFNLSYAQDNTTPGLLSLPYPTIRNLAIEWLITGDDNMNGVVTVKYRAVGDEEWQEAMPLRRIPAGQSIDTSPIFSWKNKHSGSIFDLEPDTEYEINLKLSDPDGGEEERTVRARTRAVPAAAQDAMIKQVTPETFNDSAVAARPGDILLMAPGYYKYGFAQHDGEPGKYVVFRADRSDTAKAVTFDSFSLRNRKYVILEGVTVNGSVNILGAEEVAVVRCTVNAVYGIVATSYPGAKNCYIADNVVTYSIPWIEESLGSDGINEGEGIQITGPGNVICYNRVSGYRDCISTMEDNDAYNQYCIDIYDNDIYVGADDAIEADFCMGNCRIMRNRITNCFMGLSSQPGLGGSTYFIRNVMYNIIDCPFKLARYTKGDVILHNTVVKVGDGFRVIHNPSLALFRNNLTVGGEGGGDFGKYSSGEGRPVEFTHADSTCDLDYDGIGTKGTPFVARVGPVKVYSFEDLVAQTTEKHAVLVDMTVFSPQVEFPNPPFPEREPADLRLVAGSAAVDAGLFIPNVNSGYTGSAPDLGAYELGSQVPHYGPRPEGWSPGAQKSCDFSGDSRVAIDDVIAFLLVGRDDPANPLVDWNRDGAYTIADAVALLIDILNGACPDVSLQLASTGDLSAFRPGLSQEDIRYIEGMIDLMNLSSEQQDALRLALYGEDLQSGAPKAFSLEQNAPNPFNPSTTISYTVPEGSGGILTLKIYDLRGRLVCTLVDGLRGAGSYTVFWDGNDDRGRAAASGVYLYRLEARDFIGVRKMVLLK